MTALTQYERLESPGTWRPAPDGQRREVVVKFRNESLVLTEALSDRPLSHWSLPAVTRANPGKLPAIYTPGDGPDESLEIEDEIMVEAIERVHAIIAARRPHPGRLRGLLAAVSALAIAGVAFFWLPSALIGHAASVAPQAKRVEIGRAVLAELETLTGPACENPAGEQVLSRLSRRVFGRPARIEVLPGAVEGVRRLPGDLFVVGHELIDSGAGPDLLAAQLIEADLVANPAQGGVDPLRAVLRWAGMRAAFRLLTTGSLPDGAVSGYGQTLIETPAVRADAETLSGALTAVRLSPAAYLSQLAGDDPRRAALTEPEAGAQPALSDAEWAALQTVCGG